MNMMEEQYHPMNHRLEDEGMNMVEEQYHPMNHRLEVEDMNMVGIHMVEVEGIKMVEERPSNHQPEVEGMDREDMMVEVEVVEREHEDVVLTRHCTGDRAEMHQRAHREWEELVTSGCSKGHTTFASRDSNRSIWRRVYKSKEESENEMKYVWNEVKSCEDEICFF
jgi:hypothetical protein